MTVHENYYEEALDEHLVKLLPIGLRIEKVKAFGITKPRLIGDIGLRAYFQLYKKAKQLIRDGKIDFLYITIPSFYGALLGRWLNKITGVKYGIDYIDPWVHRFPGSEKFFSRHWFSTQIALFLEPIAVKKASLITGVAAGYYKGVIERNPHLLRTAVFGAMPYGADARDHLMIDTLGLKPYLFEKKKDKMQLVYAGAMLPKAYDVLEKIFNAIQDDLISFDNVEFHFIGTGKLANDPLSFNIKPIAEKYNLWQTVVFEYPKRIPYLDVLIHLKSADALFILGSTEPHYTPSKIYQGLLSGKPILAVLHKQSTAIKVLEDSNAGVILPFDGEAGLNSVRNQFVPVFKRFFDFVKDFNPAQISHQSFERYSAKQVTGQLADLLKKIV
ncbi:MAG: hypothetical protein WKI04_09655 [Ferruginibacter sp.]